MQEHIRPYNILNEEFNELRMSSGTNHLNTMQANQIQNTGTNRTKDQAVSSGQ